MKKIVFFILIAITLSCDNSSGDRNPYLNEPNFSYDINLNLPLYAGLTIPGNSVYIGNPGVGIRGVFVYNAGSTYFAWEASCPNHQPNGCSTMDLSGATVTCSCEEYKYSLANGSLLNAPAEGKFYGLLLYSVTSSGNSLRVYN